MTSSIICTSCILAFAIFSALLLWACCRVSGAVSDWELSDEYLKYWDGER